MCYGQSGASFPNTVAYDNHGIYSVNMQNLSIVLNVPVRSKTGAMPFSSNLRGVLNNYGSRPNGSQPATVTTSTLPWATGSGLGAGGFGANQLLSPSVKLSATNVVKLFCSDGVTVTYNVLDWALVTADGSPHELPSGNSVDTAKCLNTSFTDVVTDGSGYTVSVNTVTGIATVTSAAGITISGAVTVSSHLGQALFTPTITDTNGNSISANSAWTTITDTLGTTALTIGLVSGQPSYSWQTSGTGTPPPTAQVSVAATQYTYNTSYGCSQPYQDYTAPSATSYTTGVTLADQSTLGIIYESTGTLETSGRVHSLTLPTGGTVTFSYGAMQCPGVVGASPPQSQYIAPSTMTITTPAGPWTYTFTLNSNGTSTTTVADPSGNTTAYTFTTPFPNNTWGNTPLLSQVVHQQGSSGTIDSTDVYCYNGNTTPSTCLTDAHAYRIFQVDKFTTLNGMTLPAKPAHHQTTYDTYGNVLTSSSYDYPSATVPVLVTTNIYGSYNNSSNSCVAITGINNKLCTTTTTQNGSTISQERLTYNSHGNRTAHSVWNGSSWLTSSATYHANGTVGTSTDINGAVSTYTDADCNSLLLTKKVTTGLATTPLTTAETWDCNGGVILTSTDASNNPTTAGYVNNAATPDPLWRESSTQDPALNVTWHNYTSNTLNHALTFGTSPQSTENATTSIDSLGRPSLVQKIQGVGSSSYDTVSTSYGWTTNIGGTTSTSIPCTQSANMPCTTGITTTTLDALGRVHTIVDGGLGTITKSYIQNDVLTTLTPAPTGENAKSTQKEYDGLGRLVSVCKIMTSNGPSTCPQANSGYSGVYTTYTYTAGTDGVGTTTVKETRGAQVRTTVKDALGRVVKTVTPEAGTTTYTYDSYPSGTCGGWTAEPGDLMLMVRNDGSSVCYVHNDALHRLTDTGTNSGTGNVCKRLRYDTISSSNTVQPQPSGSTISNIGGRLVEAETDNCTAFPPTPTSMITDEWFSYDVNGNLTDVWESTPHSAGYYHTTASYYPNHVVNTLGGIPGFTTETYAPLDGEGRWSAAFEGTDNIVNSVVYDAMGHPTTISIGSSNNTDNDHYVYDPATGRMTNWTFYVGANNRGSHYVILESQRNSE